MHTGPLPTSDRNGNSSLESSAHIKKAIVGWHIFDVQAACCALDRARLKTGNSIEASTGKMAMTSSSPTRLKALRRSFTTPCNCPLPLGPCRARVASVSEGHIRPNFLHRRRPDAVHFLQVFWASEGAVLCAILNNVLGKLGADPRQGL